jgi:hypothetical protein
MKRKREEESLSYAYLLAKLLQTKILVVRKLPVIRIVNTLIFWQLLFGTT